MKDKLKSLFIIFIAIALLYFAQVTYAKYKEGISGNTDFEIASWNIVVNGEDIYNKKVLNKLIEPTFISNEYVEDGVLAPGVEAYYDIVINTEAVNVTFDYSLTVKNSSDLKDIGLYGYIINPDTNDEFIETNESITGTIDKGISSLTIRVFVKWNDDEDNEMDNEADTIFATSTRNITISNELMFIQKKAS